ncbi:hypothetical protein [Galbibacter sp.]|uniref:hypothetical protein n=1 Tax=Galbibacter sp. TaxID=2918471 RepID=UPI002CC51D29|nr:hypothetical protein [Galbibacter sp.]HLV61920.1 hypothetical protein [Galbibacter sp.]
MKELDLLKKDWKKREKNLPKLSYEDIYKMILKKSSSSVRWIFYISLLELGLGLLIILFYHPNIGKQIQLPGFIDFFSYISIPVLLYFAYRFFQNYRNISTTSSVKDLLESIMKARRTVRLYIILNLVLGGLASIITFIYVYVDQQGGWNIFVQKAQIKDYLIIFVVAVIATLIVLAALLGIYLLLYGFLMRRLKLNYKELKKMEV